MGKGDWVRPRRISREQYGENFECIFGTKKLNNEEDADGIQGDTGDGHGRHVHGCDGCCAQNDFPLRSRPMELGEPCEHCGNTEYTSKDVYCKVCKRALRGAW